MKASSIFVLLLAALSTFLWEVSLHAWAFVRRHFGLFLVLSVSLTAFYQHNTMEAAVTELRKLPESAVETIQKQLELLKSEIKHRSVPEPLISDIFLVLQQTIAHKRSQQVVLRAFATLTVFLKRLHGQDQGEVIAYHGKFPQFHKLQRDLTNLQDTDFFSRSSSNCHPILTRPYASLLPEHGRSCGSTRHRLDSR